MSRLHAGLIHWLICLVRCLQALLVLFLINPGFARKVRPEFEALEVKL